MEQELLLVAMNPDSKALKARASFNIVEKALEKVKAYVQGNDFTTKEDEIHFFKNVKPQFQHQLIYYGELTFIEINRPVGDKETLISYLRKTIKRNSEYIERHKILHNYYHLGYTDEDELLFLRNAEAPPFYPEYDPDLDHSFSTTSSTVLCKILAFEKVNSQLAREIEHLKEVAEQSFSQPGEKKGTLVWTDSKAALVELAYALLARGSANYGKADLNQIMQTLEIAFNIQAGNYYRTFTDLSNRKKGRTPFLDSLKEHLERRMDERL